MDFLSPLLGFFGTATNAFVNKGIADRTNKINLQIARESNSFNERMMREAHELQEESFLKHFNLQNARQDYLNNTSMITQKMALRNAGLNPALALGGSTFSGNVAAATGGSVTAPSAVTPTMSPAFLDFDMSTVAGVYSTLENTKADIAIKKEQARALRRENDRNEGIDTTLRNAFPYAVTSSGAVLDNVDDYNDFIEKNPDEMVTPIIYGDKPNAFYSGTYDAKTHISHSLSEISVSEANIAQNNLQKRVSSGQLESSDVVNSLIRMPAEQYVKLSKEVASIKNELSLFDTKKDMLNTQNDILKIEKTIKESENIGPLLDKVLSPDVPLSERFKQIVLLLVYGLVKMK